MSLIDKADVSDQWSIVGDFRRPTDMQQEHATLSSGSVTTMTMALSAGRIYRIISLGALSFMTTDETDPDGTSGTPLIDGAWEFFATDYGQSGSVVRVLSAGAPKVVLESVGYGTGRTSSKE